MEQFRSEDLGEAFFNVLEGTLEADDNNILDFDALEFALDARMDVTSVPADMSANAAYQPMQIVPVYNNTITTTIEGPPFSRSSDSMGHSGESNHYQSLFMGFDWKGFVKQQPSDEGDGTAEVGTTMITTAAHKKKRTRNEEQMHMNRVAQQKYRERKKAEQSELKTAVDQLAAQLAAFKALEVRTALLEQNNEGLQETVNQQAQQLNVQQEMISSQQAQLNEAAAISLGQQKMILEQHKKLQLQEQVIMQLKDRLKVSVESALANLNDGNVCQHVMAAVKSALHGAKDVEGLSELLEKLPDALVVEICKNVMATCKKLWPELHQQVHSRCSASYTDAVPALQP